MKTKRPDRKNSGQVLVITSLVVVLLLISTIVFVTETQKNAPVYHASANSDFAAVKQVAWHTAISALANISNGGTPNVLSADLTRFVSAVISSSYSSIVDLEFTASDITPYADGVWLSRGISGEGVSSVIVDLALNSSGYSASYYATYTVNVTTSIAINGVYTTLNESEKQVTIYCNLLNEGKPAAAETLAVYYEQDNPAAWVQATTPTMVNYGNGTYQTTFTTQNTTQNLLSISVHCQDTRGISAWANATLTS